MNAKTAEQIEIPFGGTDSCGSMEPCIRWGQDRTNALAAAGGVTSRRCGRLLTDARSDGRATLLIAERTAITRETGDSVLARALAGRLVARLTHRTDTMTVAGYVHDTPHHASEWNLHRRINNNNNNVRLLNCWHTAQLTILTSATQGGTQQPPGRAALYTEGLSRLNCCHTRRTAIESTAPA